MEQIDETPLTILVIAKDDSTFDWGQLSSQQQNYKLVGRYDSVRQAQKRLKQTQVDVILADTSGEGVLDAEWIRNVTIQAAGVVVLIIAENSEMDFVRQAMLAGAYGFLLKPFDLPDLSRSIEQVYGLWMQRYALFTETADRLAKPSKKAYSIAAFSPKGGSGVTTIAVNLATALQQLTDSPVLLVDADLQTADVDIFLNMFNKLTILDLININQEEVDYELLEQVTKEHSTGITVLLGNPNLQFIDPPVNPGQMSTLIEELMTIWEGYIVVNTGSNLDRATVEVIDTVDTVLLVATPELSTLRAIRNFVDITEIDKEPGDKWQVIMNSYQNQKSLQMSDIEESIHHPIATTITQDTVLAPTSINRGIPLILSNMKSAVAKDIMALAKQLIEAGPWPKSSQTQGSSKQTNTKEVVKQ